MEKNGVKKWFFVIFLFFCLGRGGVLSKIPIYAFGCTGVSSGGQSPEAAMHGGGYSDVWFPGK
jgi:hypothetical protein